MATSVRIFQKSLNLVKTESNKRKRNKEKQPWSNNTLEMKTLFAFSAADRIEEETESENSSFNAFTLSIILSLVAASTFYLYRLSFSKQCFCGIPRGINFYNIIANYCNFRVSLLLGAVLCFIIASSLQRVKYNWINFVDHPVQQDDTTRFHFPAFFHSINTSFSHFFGSLAHLAATSSYVGAPLSFLCLLFWGDSNSSSSPWNWWESQLTILYLLLVIVVSQLTIQTFSYLPFFRLLTGTELLRRHPERTRGERGDEIGGNCEGVEIVRCEGSDELEALTLLLRRRTWSVANRYLPVPLPATATVLALGREQQPRSVSATTNSPGGTRDAIHPDCGDHVQICAAGCLANYIIIVNKTEISAFFNFYIVTISLCPTPEGLQINGRSNRRKDRAGQKTAEQQKETQRKFQEQDEEEWKTVDLFCSYNLKYSYSSSPWLLVPHLECQFKNDSSLISNHPSDSTGLHAYLPRLLLTQDLFLPPGKGDDETGSNDPKEHVSGSFPATTPDDDDPKVNHSSQSGNDVDVKTSGEGEDKGGERSKDKTREDFSTRLSAQRKKSRCLSTCTLSTCTLSILLPKSKFFFFPFFFSHHSLQLCSNNVWT